MTLLCQIEDRIAEDVEGISTSLHDYIRQGFILELRLRNTITDAIFTFTFQFLLIVILPFSLFSLH